MKVNAGGSKLQSVCPHPVREPAKDEHAVRKSHSRERRPPAHTLYPPRSHSRHRQGSLADAAAANTLLRLS